VALRQSQPSQGIVAAVDDGCGKPRVTGGGRLDRLLASPVWTLTLPFTLTMMATSMKATPRPRRLTRHFVRALLARGPAGVRPLPLSSRRVPPNGDRANPILGRYARLAQWTERMASDHEVRGSSPLAGTVPRIRGTPAWAAGGTGRRARLRGVWGHPSGFESRAAHHITAIVLDSRGLHPFAPGRLVR
jgi:hypothetical protein